MTRAWFLTMCLTAVLAACATPENATVDASRPLADAAATPPQTSAGGRKAPASPAEASSSTAQTPYGDAPENEGRAACLRKGSVIEAWSCAFKD